MSMLNKAKSEKRKAESGNTPKNNSWRGGFTLIEVITALSIVMVGVISAYALVNQSLSAANSASMQLTAAYLGKEGIEIVKNIRDTNYLKYFNSYGGYDENSWKSGLVPAGAPTSVNCAGASGCTADYKSGSVTLSTANAGQPLKVDSNGLFSYSSGSSSAYKRKITVNDNGSYLNVNVRIDWSERGHNRWLVVEENLYKWSYE